MEFVLVILMVVAGVVLAIVLGVGLMVFDRSERDDLRLRLAGMSQTQIAAALCFRIARSGGGSIDEARSLAKAESGVEAPGTLEADIQSWAAAFSRRASVEAREQLLESAVRIAVSQGPTIPRSQYAALMDLSFALGFHSDALARLRARYRFDFVDEARGRRPAATAFRGAPRDERRSLETLGLAKRVSRRELVASYRRMAALVHPDRFHDASEAEQARASARFIRLTEAYEDLLPFCRDD